MIEARAPSKSSRAFIAQAKQLASDFERMAYDLAAFPDGEIARVMEQIIVDTRRIFREATYEAQEPDKLLVHAVIDTLESAWFVRKTFTRTPTGPVTEVQGRRSEAEINEGARRILASLVDVRPDLRVQLESDAAQTSARALIRARAGIRGSGPGIESAMGRLLAALGVSRRKGTIHQDRMNRNRSNRREG